MHPSCGTRKAQWRPAHSYYERNYQLDTGTLVSADTVPSQEKVYLGYLVAGENKIRTRMLCDWKESRSWKSWSSSPKRSLSSKLAVRPAVCSLCQHWGITSLKKKKKNFYCGKIYKIKCTILTIFWHRIYWLSPFTRL